MIWIHLLFLLSKVQLADNSGWVIESGPFGPYLEELKDDNTTNTTISTSTTDDLNNKIQSLSIDNDSNNNLKDKLNVLEKELQEIINGKS